MSSSSLSSAPGFVFKIANREAMQRLATSLRPLRHLGMMGSKPSRSASISSRFKSCAVVPDEPELGEFLDYMEKLKNYETVGVPQGAGTDTDDGFDLGRMRRLLQRLGNPHKQFKAVHIAGTKGKGSTASFISNILREEGYSVGCYTSPHLLSTRERISVGRSGDPVSASLLKKVFCEVKEIIDQSVEQEKGALTHFEVFTALAYLLFSEERVDIAVIEAGLGGARDATNVICSTELAASVITSIGEEHLAALGGSLESIAMAKSGIIKHGCPVYALCCDSSLLMSQVVIGGPFESHIECIIRHKASLMKSMVISACDPGIRKTLKWLRMEEDGKPSQTCDIFITLPNVNLHLLGAHQLQNAVTAACTALCLRDQGWVISEKSIRAGLEKTRLLGRSQFLTQMELSSIGLSGTTILIDGAHTEASAKGLAEVIRMVQPDGVLAFLVAMASDKDHLAFARQLLSGRRPELILLTEVSIAGGRSRIALASTLKEAWTKALLESGADFVDTRIMDDEKAIEDHGSCSLITSDPNKMMLASCENASIVDSVKLADQLLKSRSRDQPALIVVTGSLHVVSSLLAALHH
ncbi:Mur ligase middle domain [Musa troglodytarum]|uniref:Mur ligase middle domain n=1 Tax=Musa troglodytarum TaxID=320322 RepID=A0A9E7L8T9_9LILI|nr:Mur ligase middle domain [Musa troglodytarum]